MSAIPPEIASQIRAGGHSIDARATAALYDPLQEREPYRDVSVSRNLSYGPDPQNLADVFAPSEKPAALRPVLVFVHGGGYTQGERRLGAASPFYDNIGLWAVRHGFIGVNITYRRAPKARWPAGAEDVGLAISWLKANIAGRGGNPKAVFLIGHSAGAAHVAGYLSHRQFWGDATPGARGAIILSGSFTVTTGDVLADEASYVERERAYFSTDPARIDEESSIEGLLNSPVPILFANAEYDPEFFLRRREGLKEAFQSAHKSGRFVMLQGHNHMSEVFSINTSDTSLTGEIERFVRSAL